ncbi:MAG: hypothetical protein ACR2F6_07965 [Mycobacteriales bacterium]
MSDEYFGDGPDPDHDFDHGFDHGLDPGPDHGLDPLGGHDLGGHDGADGSGGADGYDGGVGHEDGGLDHLVGSDGADGQPAGEHTAYDRYDLPEHADGHGLEAIDDTDGLAADPYTAEGFPEALHTEVTPADGLSWTEPELLGTGEAAAEHGTGLVDWVPRAELVDGLPDDDPAGRALISFWSQS